MTPLEPITHDLVLAGGGHAHVEVLRMLAMKPVPGLRVTLISRSRTAIYSGMVPGFVAGQYGLDEISVNLDRLCVLGGHRLIIGEITGLDPVAQEFSLAGRPALGFDSASINVGSAPDLSVLPGATEHATPVKPIEGFARSFTALEERSDAGRIAIVGGGAGGVELALALSSRFPQREFSLIDQHPTLLHRLPAAAGAWAARRLKARGVSLHLGEDVQAITAYGPQTKAQIEADMTLLVTGSKAPDWIGRSGLACDEQGFVSVSDTLQSISHPAIFAAGDCADMQAFPREKAGVFAVRAGPGLARNLARHAQGQATQSIRMQARGLQLIGDGKGAAAALWGPFATGLLGRLIFAWKDRIDRLWMARYNDFGAAMVAEMEADPERMRCSGCGGKVGPDVLRESIGALATSGDVAALGGSHVGSVDLIRDAFDDPYLFARIAGVHALSDLHAAGATAPQMLSALTLPYAKPVPLARDLGQVRAGLESLNVPIVGGHTAEGAELSAALTVIGDAPASDGTTPTPGDALILTKPLGVGLILAARMLGKVDPSAVQSVFAHCQQSNAAAAGVLAGFDVGLRTDVTGFGLLGHLHSTLPTGLGASLTLATVPMLAGAREAYERGVRPSLLEANQRVTAPNLRGAFSASDSALLHDPQTSGGLLVSLPSHQAKSALEALWHAGYPDGRQIGTLTDTGYIDGDWA